ncbi:MAG TPA: hypothetical protein ENI62_04000, partial [Gammaproteobacteria bacterium]|nr:hypothetical protein [Gammaproteobacteria bacterium]
INEGAGQHFEPRMVRLFNQILPMVQDIGRQYSDACEPPTSPGIRIASERVAFNGDYLTGNEVIDNQHRKIFDIINNTHNAIIDGDIYLCEKLFYSFNKTVAEHLQSEERILTKSQYPHLAEHCVFHRELLARTENIAGKCKDMQDKAGLLKCFDELIQFFINDVMRDDLDFKLHLQETGFANK